MCISLKNISFNQAQWFSAIVKSLSSRAHPSRPKCVVSDFEEKKKIYLILRSKWKYHHTTPPHCKKFTVLPLIPNICDKYINLIIYLTGGDCTSFQHLLRETMTIPARANVYMWDGTTENPTAFIQVAMKQNMQPKAATKVLISGGLNHLFRRIFFSVLGHGKWIVFLKKL